MSLLATQNPLLASGLSISAALEQYNAVPDAEIAIAQDGSCCLIDSIAYSHSGGGLVRTVLKVPTLDNTRVCKALEKNTNALANTIKKIGLTEQTREELNLTEIWCARHQGVEGVDAVNTALSNADKEIAAKRSVSTAVVKPKKPISDCILSILETI